MWKIPKKYREKEILYRRLILFTLSLGLIVVYFAQILDLIGAAIWVLLPFIIGGGLAFVLNTFTRVMIGLVQKAFHIRLSPKYETLYKVIATLIIISALGAIVIGLVPILISSAERVASEVPLQMQRVVDEAYLKTVNIPFIHNWMNENQELLSDMPQLLSKMFSFITTGGAGDALGGMKDFISSTFSWIWVAFLSIVFSFIAFFNTRQFISEGKLIAKAYLPDALYEKTVHLITMVSRIFSQYLGGTVLECLILATLVSVGGLIFGVPNAILVGVVCGTCALVPMFGATAGAIMCTLFIFLESPGKAITFLIMFVCIQQVEGNFIYPNVVGKTVGLPAMYVVVAITIGASLAGILGMIVSIPVATVIYELITEQASKRVEAKDLLESLPDPSKKREEKAESEE